jgi:predicted dithiol-disulfide oxidoreductase (DUF899 family)
MSAKSQPMPMVVTEREWQAARDALLTEEKQATKLLDTLAAKRRRLPMVEIQKPYSFTGAQGAATLVDLFDGRRQMILYHFMFGPDEKEGCSGCSMTVDDIGHLAHLHARDTSLVLVSRAPIEKLNQFKQRMGWSVPWFSSFGSDFNYDFAATVGESERSVTSVFYRAGERVYRTYSTSGRGDEMLGSVWSFLDLTPLGRQETWEDSPTEWPQTRAYDWWRHHDRYEPAFRSPSCACH